MVLGRTPSAVKNKLRRMGLRNHQKGQYHHRARLTDEQARAVGVLYDAGFTPASIHKLLSQPVDVTYHNVYGICTCLTRTDAA